MSNVGQIASAAAGASIGFVVGGPIGAIQGASIGLTIGSMIFPTPLPGAFGPKLDDLKVTISTYGVNIPRIYGTFRGSGNIIWATDLVEVSAGSTQGGKGGGGQPVTDFSYFGNWAMALSGRNIYQIKRLWGNKKIIFDIDAPDTPVPSVLSDGVSLEYNFPGRGIIRIYHGNQTIPDARIVTEEGAGNVPNYKEIAYIVFTGEHGYALADFGNAIPSVEAEIQADQYISVGDVIRDIASITGATVNGEMWVSDELKGYAIGSQTNAVDALVPLSLAYDFDMIEERQQISIARRPRMIVATLTEEDLGVHAGSEFGSDILPLMRSFEATLPIQVDVSYPDADYDYQTATQSVQRVSVKGSVTRQVQVPVVLTPDQARRIATRIMWGEAGERISVSIRLSWQWNFLRAGQIIVLPVLSGLMPFRILKMIMGQDNTISLDLVFDDYAAYIYQLAGALPKPTGNEFGQPEIASWIVIDAPLLDASHISTGFYFGITSGPGWRGAVFKRSIDGSNFTAIEGTSKKATIGDVAVALPAGSTEIWDEVNTLSVVLRASDLQLDTVTDLDVFNGANACWLGPDDGSATGEIIQFRTATLTAPNTYTLSGLLRGRLGTEFANGLHGSDEVLVLLNKNLFTEDFGLSDWNKIREYVAYSRYVDESLVTPSNFTNTGERAKPRSPVHIMGSRDVSNNLSIEWTRRTRTPTTGLADLVPLSEAIESYEIDVYSGPTVVRTISAAVQNAAYSAADQTTDGFTPGDPINLKIYQLSDIRGRGHEASALI